MKFFRNQGFTLIELLVVIVIIGILSAIGTVTYDSYISSSKKSLSKSQFDQVVKYIKNDMLLSFDAQSFSNQNLKPNDANSPKEYAEALAEYFKSNASFKNPYNSASPVVLERIGNLSSPPNDISLGQIMLLHQSSSNSSADLGVLLRVDAEDQNNQYVSTTIKLNW